MRKVERRLLLIASIWNMLTSILTIIGYAPWFREKGTRMLNTNKQNSYFSSSLVDSIVQISMIYGLLMFSISLVGIYMSYKMKDNQINTKMIVWVVFCLLISFVSFDVLSILLYSIVLVIYVARNKSIKKQNRII